MSGQVREVIDDGVLILTFGDEPPHVLSPEIRAQLIAAIEAAPAREDVTGIVLAGSPTGFSEGVDLYEYWGPQRMPSVGALCMAVEASPKPIVAALHGAVKGAGLELALAAHARVARPGTQVWLPDLQFGLIPGGGGTQRLPRLVGGQAALHLALSARPADLFSDRLSRLARLAPDGSEDEAPVTKAPVTKAPVAEAAARVREMVQYGAWRRTCDETAGFLRPGAFQQALSDARATLGTASSNAAVAAAEADLVACIEAAQLLPFEQGMAFEAERFHDRLADPAARALRHHVMARHRALRGHVPPPAQAEPAPFRELQRCALLGGSGQLVEAALLILPLLAPSGGALRLLNGDASRAVKLVALVREGLARQVRAGAISREEGEARSDRLGASTDPSLLAEAEIVLDTGTLELPVATACNPDAIWVLLDAPGRDSATAAKKRAAQLDTAVPVLSLGARRPMQTAALFELAPRGDMCGAAVARLGALLTHDQRSVIATSGAPGGVTGALLAAFFRAALGLLAAGRASAEIEAAGRALGFRQGPLRMIDEAGATRVLAEARQVYSARATALRPFRLLSDRVADVADGDTDALPRVLAFHQPAGQTMEEDPALTGWLAEWRDDNRESLADAGEWPEISLQGALEAALVNEAARLLEAGVVRQPSDIDLAFTLGLGYAPERGGLLLQSDMAGRLGIMRSLRALARFDPPLWAPVRLLDDMVKNGRQFF